LARLASLNIERSRHLGRFIPFLRQLAPDVVCLQELVARDIEAIKAGTGLAHVCFAPMAVHPVDGELFGVGILAREPFEAADWVVYAGGGDGTQLFDRTTDESKVATCRYLVARTRLGGADQGVTVATTHFPWTPDGRPRGFQAEAAERLIAELQGPVVLTGDFNAPRGGPIFAALARNWRDCIPADVATSVDPDLHRAGPLQLMVDGLFLTPDYRANDVALHTGLSDHQGITAEIARVRG
jgi:endonuclease/exonuclease/phosphatase family metal-dependent hydrolase